MALLTTASIRPIRPAAAMNAARSTTSTTYGVIDGEPRSSPSDAASISNAATVAPACAAPIARARPSPRPAPVIRMDFPERSNVVGIIPPATQGASLLSESVVHVPCYVSTFTHTIQEHSVRYGP